MTVKSGATGACRPCCVDVVGGSAGIRAEAELVDGQ